jgi:glycine betaine/choline ABC-type transport system substrate-binding protein
LLVSARAAAKRGFMEALKPLVSGRGGINDATMQAANRQVDVEGKLPRQVALDLVKIIAARRGESGGQ